MIQLTGATRRPLLRDARMTEAFQFLNTCWRDAPSFLCDAQMTEAFPNLLSIMAQRAT
ncbi:hypothetical protein A2U01_0094223, partial [Trifolium medium]|nr:hypothetical protein [Trifolium medium]